MVRPKFDLRSTRSRRAYGNGARTSQSAFGTIARSAGVMKRRTMVPVVGQGIMRNVGYYGRNLGLPGGELKFHDVDLDDAQIAQTGTITPTINIIPQGVTEVQRVGRKCTLKSIGWRYTLTLPETDAVPTPDTGDTARIILYLDKQCNGATAAILDILETADYQSFNNLANKNRFQILHDKLVTLNYMSMASDNAGVVSQSRVLREGACYKKLDLPIEFSATTGAITEIRSNNLGVLLISSNTKLDFASKIRIRFSDY